MIDPIDGSLNMRRTIPGHSLSVAVASGSAMADVDFAYVYDFGAGEEFTARRGLGARSTVARSAPRASSGAGDRRARVGQARVDLPIVDSLQGHAYRIRAVGAIAITLSWVAAGRVDGMITARECRSVDAAAAQLIAREAGAEVAFGDAARGNPALARGPFPLLAGLRDEWLELLWGSSAPRRRPTRLTRAQVGSRILRRTYAHKRYARL